MSDPAVISWGDSRLDIFVVGTDRALYHKWWDGSAWGPSFDGFESLGGTCIAGPYVTSSGPDRLDVFITGSDNSLYQRSWNGSTWSDWRNLGGTVLTSASQRPGTNAPNREPPNREPRLEAHDAAAVNGSATS
jgi:hypothetical protein